MAAASSPVSALRTHCERALSSFSTSCLAGRSQRSSSPVALRTNRRGASGWGMKMIQVVQLQACSSASAFGITGLPARLLRSSPISPLTLRKSARVVEFRKRVPRRDSTRTRRGGAVVVHSSSGGNEPGDKDSKAVYDAFFLGKALAEAITERVGSAIGEFLSDVGRQQAEQQKTIREFQDEVQQRAAVAALKAAQKALAAERSKEGTKPRQRSSSPAQPPPSTSGLSNPEDAPTSISIE